MTRPLALVTGATAGIGLATARALAGAGFEVAVTGRRADKVAQIAAELDGIGLVWDVRDAAGIDKHAALLGRVDVLVNNAGLARGTDPLQSGNPDDWDEVIDTNVKGLLRVTRSVLPGMVSRGRGHVVMLGSTAGHWVYPGGAVYCASKHAVKAITEGLRMDVHGSGIRVTSVDPGLVGGTEFSDVRFKGDHERARKVYEGLTPLSAADIAETILWCVQRPAHVNIQDIVLTPTAQSAVTMVKRV